MVSGWTIITEDFISTDLSGLYFKIPYHLTMIIILDQLKDLSRDWTVGEPLLGGGR